MEVLSRLNEITKRPEVGKDKRELSRGAFQEKRLRRSGSGVDRKQSMSK